MAQRAVLKEEGKVVSLKPEIASACTITKRQRMFRECVKAITQLMGEDRKIRWRKALKKACEDSGNGRLAQHGSVSRNAADLSP